MYCTNKLVVYKATAENDRMANILKALTQRSTQANIILQLDNIRRRATSSGKLGTKFYEILFNKVRFCSKIPIKTTLTQSVELAFYSRRYYSIQKSSL